MRLLQHLFLLVVLCLCQPRGRHGRTAAAAAEGETVSASYLAHFVFSAWPDCYMDPVFEFGCTSGGSTLVVDKVNLLPDESPVTCVSHPSRGPQFVQCTVGRESGGSSTSTTAGTVEFSLYSASFECHGGSSSGSSSLAAAAASNVKDAACGPSITQQVYQECSLSVYDWKTTQFVSSSSCETGTLELASSGDHVCSAAAHCKGGLVAGCSLTSALVSPRVVFNGFSLPAGAVESGTRGIDYTDDTDDSTVVVGLIIIVVVLIAIGAGIGLAIYFCCCKKKKRESANDDGSRSNNVAPAKNRPGGGDTSSASESAAFSTTATSSATAPPPIFLPKPALVDTTRIIPPATSSATAPPPKYFPKPALVDTTRIIPAAATGADSFVPNSVMSPQPVFGDVPNVALVTSPGAELTYKDQVRSHRLEHVPVATAHPIDP